MADVEAEKVRNLSKEATSALLYEENKRTAQMLSRFSMANA